MYAEIAAALQSARTLADLLKAANKLGNYNELVAAVSEVSSRLVDAQSVALESQEKQAALLEAKSQLEARIRELEASQSELARYELRKLALGGLVYALKNDMGRGEPEHFLCAACMSKGVKSILQDSGSYLNCPNKHDAIRHRQTPTRQVRTEPDY